MKVPGGCYTDTMIYLCGYSKAQGFGCDSVGAGFGYDLISYAVLAVFWGCFLGFFGLMQVSGSIKAFQEIEAFHTFDLTGVCTDCRQMSLGVLGF